MRNRTLMRPMFRMGGSSGTGITSGLDRPGYASGTTKYGIGGEGATFASDMITAQKLRNAPQETAFDIASDAQSRIDLANRFAPRTTAPFSPGSLSGFLTSTGLNLLSATPRGNIFATAAGAAKEPFDAFTAAKGTDSLMGAANNIKGIAHELIYIKTENEDGDSVFAFMPEDTNHPQFDVLTVNNTTVKISGIIDRIDLFNGKLRVIDYKSGLVNPAVLDIKNLDKIKLDYKYSNLLQLLIYKLLVSNNYKDLDIGQIGIYSVKKSTSPFISIKDHTQISIKEVEKLLVEIITDIIQTNEFINTENPA